MSRQTTLTLLEEGLANGGISSYMAAYIAAEIPGVEARTTGYDDTIRLEDAALS